LVHPRISMNAFTTRDQSLVEDIALCHELGIRHLGLVASKFADSPQDAAARCRDADIQVNFIATTLGDVKPVELGDGAGIGLLDQLRPTIDAAEIMGASLVYFTSGAPPRRALADLAFAALAKALEPAVIYAAGRGLRLGVENSSVATRAHGFIHTMADAVRMAGQANIGITMEIQNCWVEIGLEALVHAHVDKIALVQVSDFSVGENLSMNRRVPGDGDIPIEQIIGLLLGANYQGLFDIELVGPHIDSEGAVSAVRRSAKWLDEVLNRLGA